MLLAYSRENFEEVEGKELEGLLIPQYNLYQKLSDVWRIVEDFYMTCIADGLKDDEIREFYMGIMVRIKALSTRFRKRDGESEEEYLWRVVGEEYAYDTKQCFCKSIMGRLTYEDGDEVSYGYIVATDEDGKSWKNEFWNIVRGVSVNDTWFTGTHTKFLDALNMCLDAFKHLWNSDSGKCGMVFVWDRSEIILKLKAIDSAVLEVLIDEVGLDEVKKRVSTQTEINSKWKLLKGIKE